jgi:hypothetical protein
MLRLEPIELAGQSHEQKFDLACGVGFGRDLGQGGCPACPYFGNGLGRFLPIEIEGG